MQYSEIPLAGLPTGLSLVINPVLNKGTAFTEEERDLLGLRGLLPPRVCDQEEQLLRILENFRRCPTNLEKYVYLVGLQDRNETLFYRAVIDDPATMMPILYTPTVGEACQRYGHIYRRPRGLFITAADRGRIARILGNWPHRSARVIVVTDGERILGLGDLGVNGMGIPVGKLTLYTALGGVDPTHCLPVTIDVGTNNQTLLEDALYIGTRHQRLRGPAYEELLDEFMVAANAMFPGVLIQFEDFATHNALHLLERNRHRYCCFNDDIQGTGAVALAGLMSAARAVQRPMADHKFLFYGAGEAGVGIGELTVSYLVSEGMDREEALQRCWFMDSKGLVVASRQDLAAHKRTFAHQHPAVATLDQAIEALRPTALIGVSGQGSAFSESALRAMARLNTRPIIFALSNPTSKSECTADEAYRFSDGRAIFASGSPFAPVVYNGREFVPGQGNNAYIFPGIGLGVVLGRIRRVTEGMFAAAARTLASLVTSEDLAQGRVYPSLDRIREVSAHIAAEVIRVAVHEGLSGLPLPSDTLEFARSSMYQPKYRNYVCGSSGQLL